MRDKVLEGKTKSLSDLTSVLVIFLQSKQQQQKSDILISITEWKSPMSEQRDWIMNRGTG